jgi:hypothetical protein
MREKTSNISTAYLQSVTVMQSVATINSVRRADLSQQGCVTKSMLILPYPLGITVQHWTLGTNREPEPRVSLAYVLQNTYSILAVTRETASAEDHGKQQLKLILSSIRF